MSNTTTQSTAISTVETPDLIVDHGRPKASSLQVAAYFGKQHKNVLRAIAALELPEDYRRLNFEPTIMDVQGPKGSVRQEPMVEMTRDGFAILAMGFTGKEAMRWKIAFLEEFKRLEQLAAEGLKLGVFVIDR